MANNATIGWRWKGGVSGVWEAANWLDADGGAVDDWPAGSLPTNWIQFRGDDTPGNKCDTGPTASLTVLSVESNTGYEADAASGEFITFDYMTVATVLISDDITGCSGGVLGIVMVDGDDSVFGNNNSPSATWTYSANTLIVNGDGFIYTETEIEAVLAVEKAWFNGAGAAVEGGTWHTVNILQYLHASDGNGAWTGISLYGPFNVYGAFHLREVNGLINFGPPAINLVRREATFQAEWAAFGGPWFAPVNLALLGGQHPLEVGR